MKADSGEPAFERGWQHEESGTFRFWKVRCSLSCVTLEEACAVSPKPHEGGRGTVPGCLELHAQAVIPGSGWHGEIQ